MSDLFDPHVAVVSAQAPYPTTPPFSPPVRYPEFPWPGDETWDPGNQVYPAVRRLFLALGLDREHEGHADWNPLGGIVKPGDRVLIKPNWILHQHLSGRDPFSVITHSSVVRAVLDYVCIALKGSGQVTVADAPQANTDWTALLATTRIADTLDELRRRHGVEVELRDLRLVRVRQRNGITVNRETSDAEAILVDLGRDSSLAPLAATLGNLCGSDYDRRPTVAGHDNGHRYAAAKPVLDADVLISVAKLKVHKKTGVSLSLKNMVGINADKNFIPHYRVGDARSGGDEFPEEHAVLGRVRDRVARGAIDLLLGRLDRFAAPALSALAGHYASGHTSGAAASDPTDVGHNQRVIKMVYQRLLGKSVRAGNWSGNDTLWRAVLDLNRIALYGSAEGALLPRPARRYFAFIDGIVAGEGEGPMDPDPVAAGVLVAGFNPVAVDHVATSVMGLDPARIPVLVEAARPSDHPIAPSGEIVASIEPEARSLRPFLPPRGWPELTPTARQPDDRERVAS